MGFARLERDAWQDPGVARTYSQRFPSITAHTGEPLLTAVGAVPGTLLADIACGPGPVGVRAVGRDCHVVALDFSLPMLREARNAGPSMAPVHGSATRLPLKRGRFDAAVSNFGLLHFAEPALALTESARILRPGGRAAWSVWGEGAAAFRLVPQALESLGLDPKLPSGPGFFQYGTVDRIRGALEAAGLVEVEVATYQWDAEFKGTEGYWEAFAAGTARTRAAIRSFSGPQRTAIRLEVERRLAEFLTPNGLAVPTTALIGSGVRPPP